jgi:hypothetical protein
MFKTIRFAACFAAASLMAVPAYAQSSPVVGAWDTEAVTDFGTFKATLTVTEANGAYAVEMTDVPAEGAPPPGASSISEVTVNGADFSFKRTIDFQGQPIVLNYSGKVDGNALTATATSDFGAIPVKGTRK